MSINVRKIPLGRERNGGKKEQISALNAINVGGKMKFENIEGDLKEAYLQCKKGTMLHVDELMTERLTNAELRDKWFYTADGNVYFVKDGVPYWAITREKDNPILQNINEAFTQLVDNHNYVLTPKQLASVLKSKETMVFNLNQLDLKERNSEWSFLDIDTSNFKKSKLLVRIYGKNVSKVMKCLKDNKISSTRIYVLNPKYVMEKAKYAPLGRASWLDNFSSGSYFGAIDRSVGNHSCVRGVRRGSIKKNCHHVWACSECGVKR